MTGLLLLGPSFEHFLWVREPVAGHYILVSLDCVLRRMEVELAVMEGINIRLLGDQPEPNVIESKHPGKVARVVHVHQGVSRQDVGPGCDIGGPKVKFVLRQVHKPLPPLVTLWARPRKHKASKQFDIAREVEIHELVKLPPDLLLVLTLIKRDNVLLEVSWIVDRVPKEGQHIPCGYIIVVIYEHVKPALGTGLHSPSQAHSSLNSVVEVCVLKIPLNDVLVHPVFRLDLGLELDIME